jgi:hypothetical protein
MRFERYTRVICKGEIPYGNLGNKRRYAYPLWEHIAACLLAITILLVHGEKKHNRKTGELQFY